MGMSDMFSKESFAELQKHINTDCHYRLMDFSQLTGQDPCEVARAFQHSSMRKLGDITKELVQRGAFRK
jgi:hypothetical protein